MMSLPGVTSVLVLAFCVLLVGFLIGCVGIGGVLLPPALVYIGEVELHLALAISVWCFFFTGLAGTWTYTRRGSVSWPPTLSIALGIVPSAVLGSYVASRIPGYVLELFIGLVIVVVGLNTALSRKLGGERDLSELSVWNLLTLGIGVGFGSATTGTGGPVLLVPALLAARIHILSAVGLGQVSQIPVALFATVGFALNGHFMPVLATVLGFFATIGTVAGANVAHNLPLGVLQKAVALLCIGTGAFMAGLSL